MADTGQAGLAGQAAQLHGLVVIVTGAAQGMGRRHARWCAERGARVVATDLQVEAGREVVAGIAADGGEAEFVEHDVTDPAGWDHVVATTLGRFGHIDGLVNNAAVYRGVRPIEEESFETFELTMRVNVHGTWWGCRKVVEPMRSAGGGSIVNVSSTAGLRGYPGFTAYGTSKWAVRGLTKVLAAELGGWGIRVNSVHPGGIEGTGMFTPRADPAEQAARLREIPLRRHGRVEDVSAVVGFLLSPASAYVTGVEHVVDGGASVP
jgi:3alpha(or 20beta)-hydroxysteroid dehydrogenase